jgi:hypothetical protein
MIRIATVNVKTPKFSLRNPNSSNQRVLIGDAEYKTVFDGEISAANGNVSLSDFIVTGQTTGLTGSTVEVALFLDGVQVGSSQSARNLAGNDTFVLHFTSGLGEATNTNRKVELKASAQGTTGGTIYFEVLVQGTERLNGNPAESSKVDSSNLEVVGKADISVSASNKVSKLVVDNGGTIELATFDVTAQNGDVGVTDVLISGNFASLSGKQVTLYVGDNDYSAIAYDTGVLFTGITSQLKVGQNTLKLSVRPNSTKANAPTGLDVTIDKAFISAPDAATSLATGDIQTKYKIVKGLPVLSLVSKANGELHVGINYDNGPNNSYITLSGLTVNNITGAYIRDDNATLSINGGTVTISNGGQINKGNSKELVLMVVKDTVGALTAIEYVLKDGSDEYVYSYGSGYAGGWSQLQYNY